MRVNDRLCDWGAIYKLCEVQLPFDYAQENRLQWLEYINGSLILKSGRVLTTIKENPRNDGKKSMIE